MFYTQIKDGSKEGKRAELFTYVHYCLCSHVCHDQVNVKDYKQGLELVQISIIPLKLMNVSRAASMKG